MTFIWFTNLPPHFIHFFQDFSKKFMARFVIGILTKRTSAYLFSMIQFPNKTLRDYVASFNKALWIQEIQVDMVVEAMIRGTWQKEFFNSLKKSSKTMRKLMRKVEKYIWLDNASRVKREHDYHFIRKWPIKDRKGESNVKRSRREDGQRDRGKNRFNQKDRCDPC